MTLDAGVLAASIEGRRGREEKKTIGGEGEEREHMNVPRRGSQSPDSLLLVAAERHPHIGWITALHTKPQGQKPPSKQ